jgi:hypothetical protein
MREIKDGNHFVMTDSHPHASHLKSLTWDVGQDRLGEVPQGPRHKHGQKKQRAVGKSLPEQDRFSDFKDAL